MASSSKVTESERFPALSKLIGAWFHQDFDLGGDTLEQIIGNYRESAHEREVKSTREDIARFVGNYGNTDPELAAAFVDVFSPGVIVEGWEGLTTRQWLLKIADLLE